MVGGAGSFRFVTGGQGFGSGIPAVLESGEVAQRDRVQNAGRIRRRTWAGLRYAPSAPSSITKPTNSHKHWYIKRGQATRAAANKTEKTRHSSTLDMRFGAQRMSQLSDNKIKLGRYRTLIDIAIIKRVAKRYPDEFPLLESRRRRG